MFSIPKENRSAISETLLLIVLTTAPTILSFLSILFNLDSKLIYDDLFKSGEFFLYGVSFLGSSFLMFQSVNKKAYLILCFIFILSAAYTVVFNITNPNIKLLSIWSLISFVASILISYQGQVLLNKRLSIDVREYRHTEQERIQNGLN